MAALSSTSKGIQLQKQVESRVYTNERRKRELYPEMMEKSSVGDAGERAEMERL